MGRVIEFIVNRGEKAMNYTIKKENNCLVVAPTGEIDMSITDALRRDVDRALEQNEVFNIIFDLAGVSFVDSSGLGVILGRYKKVTAAGGRVFLTGAGPQVRKVLELSGLLTLMEEHRSVEHVISKIS